MIGAERNAIELSAKYYGSGVTMSVQRDAALCRKSRLKITFGAGD
jgi:hypothetical protein